MKKLALLGILALNVSYAAEYYPPSTITCNIPHKIESCSFKDYTPLRFYMESNQDNVVASIYSLQWCVYQGDTLRFYCGYIDYNIPGAPTLFIDASNSKSFIPDIKVANNAWKGGYQGWYECDTGNGRNFQCPLIERK